jgi:hypothetical protein
VAGAQAARGRGTCPVFPVSVKLQQARGSAMLRNGECECMAGGMKTRSRLQRLGSTVASAWLLSCVRRWVLQWQARGRHAGAAQQPTNACLAWCGDWLHDYPSLVWRGPGSLLLPRSLLLGKVVGRAVVWQRPCRSRQHCQRQQLAAQQRPGRLLSLLLAQLAWSRLRPRRRSMVCSHGHHLPGRLGRGVMCCRP